MRSSEYSIFPRITREGGPIQERLTFFGERNVDVHKLSDVDSFEIKRKFESGFFCRSDRESPLNSCRRG